MRFLPLVLLLAACGDASEARRVWRASDHSQPEGRPQTEQTAPTEPSAPDDGNGTARAAARLFAMECAPCHGPGGLGNGPAAGGLAVPNLGSTVVQGRSDAELATIIAEGRGAMPAFGTRYTAAAVTALVDHVRTLAPAQ